MASSPEQIRAIIAAFDHETVVALAHATATQAQAMRAHLGRYNDSDVEEDAARIEEAAAAFTTATSIGVTIRNQPQPRRSTS